MRVFLFFILLFSTLFGGDYSLDAKYDISYGFIGTVGEAKANFSRENGTYKIKIEAKATGLAKILSRNRVEVYQSSGIIKNDRLIPQIFIIKKRKSGYKETKRYLFDYKHKRINLLTSSEDGSKKSESGRVLNFFTNNDILSLFFNLKYLLGEGLSPKGRVKFVAVGANENNGEVDIFSFSKKNKRDIVELLGGNTNHLLSVILNRKIFSSKNGEMFLNLNNDGICTKAILKDVVMFGDIRGKLVYMNVNK